MKITAHACLESMMVNALRDLESAYQKLVRAKLAVFVTSDSKSHRLHSEAQIEVDNVTKRYSELLIARKIIKEMEAKGVEV